MEKKSIHPKFREKLTSEKLHHIAPLAYSSKKKVSKTSFPEIIRMGEQIFSFTMKSENNPMQKHFTALSGRREEVTRGVREHNTCKLSENQRRRGTRMPLRKTNRNREPSPTPK